MREEKMTWFEMYSKFCVFLSFLHIIVMLSYGVYSAVQYFTK